MLPNVLRNSILILVFFLKLAFAFAQHTPWREKEMEVKISFSEPQQAELLGSMNFKGEIYTSHACVYLTPDELDLVKNAGFQYTINIPDLNAWSAGFGEAQVPPGYYTFNQIKDIADSLATYFPDICRKVIYGFTPQFKELAALKISDNVNIDENEAEILFDGGIHGNEVGASQNVIQFARDICQAYGTDTYITNLVNTREIWLYYCVNPYGRDHMTRENGNGVDINRDFGYACAAESGSTGPFSQPESKALRDCQYSNQFVSYTNYHSGAEVIAYPWSYRYSATPDVQHISSLANVYFSNSGYQNLLVGQGSQIMYLIKGSTKDFNYGCLGSVAWSMEISLDKQPAGPNIQHYYAINKSAMLALIEHAGYGIEGTVTDAITGVPVKAAVWVENNYPVFTDGDAGDYHKYMVPGSYKLRFTANGYQPFEVNEITVNAMQSTVTDVQLQPVQSQFAYRTCIMQIPGFNAQNPGDEGYSAACLGPPDQVSYSLGKGGYIMVDMQNPVIDEPGPDITVYEGDTSPEGFEVYALTTMDGDWNLLGPGTGTSGFDLAAAGVQAAQFFVVKDDNNGTANVNDAGFDFDAIANNHAPIPDTLAHLSGKVFDAATGLPLPGVLISFVDTTMLTDSAGFYSLNIIRGLHEICASVDEYNTDCDTLLMVAGGELINDFYLDFNVGLPIPKAEIIFAASPNPFTEKLFIDFVNTIYGRVRIYLTPVTGAKSILLEDKYYPAGEFRFAATPSEIAGYSLSLGIYVLSVETSTSKQICKVIKVSAR
jgi:hypothetical protein